MKYKFGTREIFGLIIGVIGFLGLSLYFGRYDMNEVESFYSQLRLVWLTVFATVFGPFAGMLIGIFGSGLSNIFMGAAIDYISAFVFAMFGFYVGRYSERYSVRRGSFTLRSAVDFNVVQLTANIVAWVFAEPLLNFFFEEANVFEAVDMGIDKMLISAMVTFLVCTPVLLLFSEFMRFINSRRTA